MVADLMKRSLLEGEVILYRSPYTIPFRNSSSG